MSERITGDVWLTGLLVAATIAAMIYLFIGRGQRVASDDAARSARRWVDSLGMRVTGVVCEHERCTVAPEHGEPFDVVCGADACTLPDRQAAR